MLSEFRTLPPEIQVMFGLQTFGYACMAAAFILLFGQVFGLWPVDQQVFTNLEAAGMSAMLVATTPFLDRFTQNNRSSDQGQP